MKQQLFIDDKISVEEIELDDLRRTIKTQDQKGLSKILPIEHYEVFDRVLDTLTSNKLNAAPDLIYASGGRNAKIIKKVEELMGQDRITESYWLQKIIGTVSIMDYADGESIAKVAISYTPEGVFLAYGQEVRVCRNMSILGRSNLIDLSRIGLDKALQIVQAWAITHAEKRALETGKLQSMKSIELIGGDVERAIGKLHKAAVNQAYLDRKIRAPFTIHQLTGFTKGIMQQDTDSINTLWDLYNVGTAIMRPHESEFSTVLTQNVNWAEFLLKEYDSSEVNSVFSDFEVVNSTIMRRIDGTVEAIAN